MQGHHILSLRLTRLKLLNSLSSSNVSGKIIHLADRINLVN